MSILQYQCAMSLDGFIAGPGGDMSWLAADEGAATGENEVVASVGAVLTGNRTFRGDDPNAGTERAGAYDGQYHGPTVVLTHLIPDDPAPDVVFVDDLGRAVEHARQAAGDKLVAVLGADVARQCLEAGLLDEILVHVTPVLLGSGTRLYDRAGVQPAHLDLIEADGTRIRCRVRR